MVLKDLIKGGGLADKAIGLVDKLVPNTEKKTELRFELYKIIASSMIAKWVRAILAIMFFSVWLFFPEKLEGREEMAKYMLFAIAGFYFLVDKFNEKKFK